MHDYILIRSECEYKYDFFQAYNNICDIFGTNACEDCGNTC